MDFLKSKRIAIDLGNNNTLLADGDRVLLSEPSYIVLDENRKKVRAVGDEAYEIFEKNHRALIPVKPLRWGVIADYESAAKMMNALVAKAFRHHRWFNRFDTIISGVPYSTTEVERRALRDALEQFGARKTQLLFEPISAALGMGIDIREPQGKMIVDIGGGITEVVIISLSGIVSFKSIRVGGDNFDCDIQDFFRRQLGMIVGIKTAEMVKKQIGSVTPSQVPNQEPMIVRGKDIREGIPVSHAVRADQVAGVLGKSFEAIETCIQQVLETCPPELAADIYSGGVYVTGGGGLLHGVKDRLQTYLGIPVHIDKEPLLSVSRGAAMVLRNPKKYQAIAV
ncbi:MAG: rod shape-determining protein [Cyclobacteriaceae bacterium]